MVLVAKKFSLLLLALFLAFPTLCEAVCDGNHCCTHDDCRSSSKYCKYGGGFACKCREQWFKGRYNTGQCTTKGGEDSYAPHGDHSCMNGKSVCSYCADYNTRVKDGMKCSSNRDCKSNWCDGKYTFNCGGTCKSRVQDGGNAYGGDYNSCQSGKGVCGVCGAKVGSGKKCSANSDCKSNWCESGFTSMNCGGTCKAKVQDGGNAHESATIGWDYNSCQSGKGVCGVCGAKVDVGKDCSANEDCKSGWCEAGLSSIKCNGTCKAKVPDGGQAHKSATFGWDYNSCKSTGIGTCGICGVSKVGVGKKCSKNEDCESGTYCDGDVTVNCAGTCKKKIEDNEECPRLKVSIDSGIYGGNDAACLSGECMVFDRYNVAEGLGFAFCRPKGGFLEGAKCKQDSDCSLSANLWCNGGGAVPGQLGKCELCPSPCTNGCSACDNDLEVLACGRSDTWEKIGCAGKVIADNICFWDRNQRFVPCHDFLCPCGSIPNGPDLTCTSPAEFVGLTSFKDAVVNFLGIGDFDWAHWSVEPGICLPVDPIKPEFQMEFNLLDVFQSALKGLVEIKDFVVYELLSAMDLESVVSGGTTTLAVDNEKMNSFAKESHALAAILPVISALNQQSDVNFSRTFYIGAEFEVAEVDGLDVASVSAGLYFQLKDLRFGAFACGSSGFGLSVGVGVSAFFGAQYHWGRAENNLGGNSLTYSVDLPLPGGGLNFLGTAIGMSTDTDGFAEFLENPNVGDFNVQYELSGLSTPSINLSTLATSKCATTEPIGMQDLMPLLGAEGGPQLVDFGANPSGHYPLGLCEGDCDNDDQCAVGLKCFERSGKARVPGCSGLGVTDYDYCVLPELVDFGANPSGHYPLGLCEGDCDNDDQCAVGLKCFERSGETHVPGCSGVGVTDYDYCVSAGIHDEL